MNEVSEELSISNYFTRQLSIVKDQEERAVEKFLLSNRRVDRDIVLRRRAERKQIERFLKYIDEFKKEVKEEFSGTDKTHQESFSVEG